MSITPAEVAQETARRMRRLGLQIGEDIRQLRSDAGVSISQLAGAADVHRSHLARIEADEVQPSLTVLAAIGVALGADLSVRYFPGSGPRLHDRLQAAMIETRSAIGTAQARTTDPVGTPGRTRRHSPLPIPHERLMSLGHSPLHRRHGWEPGSHGSGSTART
jgi:transcriptional regulator with XRE-family HTH domain